MLAPRGVRAADILAQPGVQQLLLRPENAAVQAALAQRKALSPFAKQAGPDADAVQAREARSTNARRSSKAGARSELAVIGKYHKAALLRRVARMKKLPTPHRRVGHAHNPEHPGAFAAVYAERSTVDCWGFSMRGPTRAIVEEIKGVTERAPGGAFLPFRVDRVAEHQRQELAAAHLAGHVAVVTVVFGQEPIERVYVVPWSWLEHRMQAHEDELRAAGFGVTPATYLDAQTVPAALLLAAGGGAGRAT